MALICLLCSESLLFLYLCLISGRTDPLCMASSCSSKLLLCFGSWVRSGWRLGPLPRHIGPVVSPVVFSQSQILKPGGSGYVGQLLCTVVVPPTCLSTHAILLVLSNGTTWETFLMFDGSQTGAAMGGRCSLSSRMLSLQKARTYNGMVFKWWLLKGVDLNDSEMRRCPLHTQLEREENYRLVKRAKGYNPSGRESNHV